MIDDDAYEAKRREAIAADPFYEEMERLIGEDSHLANQIERQCGAYRRLLPPDAYENMRAVMAEALTEHPILAEEMRRLRPRVVPQKSGEVGVDGGASEADDAESTRKRPA